jgi:hypothetical protein
MAKSLALINKDIIQHYKLQNLLSPPEATELTKVYDELTTILNKPQIIKKQEEPAELDHYYKLLFKFMKLLHTIKFGTDIQIMQEEELKKQQEAKQIQEEAKKKDDEDKKGKKRKIQKRASSPSQASTKLIVEPPIAPDIAKPPPPRYAPDEEELIEAFEKHVPKSSKYNAAMGDLLTLLHKRFHDIQIIPGNFGSNSDNIYIHGRIYNIKIFAKILELLQKHDRFDTENLDADYKKLFSSVIRPTIEQHASEQPTLYQELAGFKSFITKEGPRTSRRAPASLDTTAIANPSHTIGQPTKLQGLSGKGLGKIHLKRWQNHIW